MNIFTELEKCVIDKALQGSFDVLNGLRQQLPSLEVVSRDMTGVGFYTNFRLRDSSLTLSPRRSFRIGDVVATVSGLTHGAGFQLFIKDGVIEHLEGYSYDEPWPPKVTTFELSYRTGAVRDEQNLSKVLS